MAPPATEMPRPPSLRVYTAQELAEATGGFSPFALIGEGGFGKVYRAMVALTPVAIKVLDHEGLQGLKEMHTEIQLLAGMQHPHLVKLLGYASEEASGPSSAPGQPRKFSALVYELQSRGNLEDRLARRGGVEPLAWQARVKVAAHAAGALAFLHSKSIIHRDIKPANVFLDADFNAKLGDIGLAAMDSLYGQATNNREGDGTAVGTWQYLAPEYRTQGGRCSMGTDAYAFGLTVLQLLSGAPHPRELVGRAQAALEDCSLATSFLDRAAGAWDLRIAERLVKLGLWCCMHDPAARPQLSVVWADMHKLLQQVQAQQQLLSARG